MNELGSRKAVKDFRGALNDAKANAELVSIGREVDPLIEIPAVLHAAGKLPTVPAILFEKVAGHQDVRCAGAVFSDAARMSRQLGFEGTTVRDKASYYPALDNPIKPETVSNGLCQENVVTRDIDVTKLIPSTHGALKVKHRYYQPVVFTKHPKTGAINASVYRSSAQAPDKVTVNFRWDQHGGLILSVAKETGTTIPVALCLGVSPAIYVMAATKMPYGYDEMDIAGGILGKPVEMVKCTTIDLEVPASSEFVIEGEIRPPYKKGAEGPWPEYLGYLGMNIQPPLMHITAVTHRNNPINPIFVAGTVPPFAGSPRDAILLRHLRGLVGEFAVDACITKGSRAHHAIIKVRKNEAHHEGLQINTALSAFGTNNQIDLVTLVDEDININNMEQIDWAVATRCNPSKQIHLLPEARTHQNNPIAGVRETEGQPIVKGKMIVDATIPWKYSVLEKGPGLTFFTKSEWPDVDLTNYFDETARSRWLST